jgi:hypothetical protein
MSTQPEALRLAEKLTAPWALRTASAMEAASELRRLHAENERLTALLADVEQVEAESASLRPHLVFCMDELRRLHAVNAELLEALDFYGRYILRNKHTREASILTPIEHDCGDRARAAIAKAEGEPK